MKEIYYTQRSQKREAARHAGGHTGGAPREHTACLWGC